MVSLKNIQQSQENSKALSTLNAELFTAKIKTKQNSPIKLIDPKKYLKEQTKPKDAIKNHLTKNLFQDIKYSKIKNKTKIKVMANISIFSIIFIIILNFPKCYNLRLNSRISSNLNEVTLKVSGTGNNI